MGDVAALWTIGHSTRGWEEFLALLATRHIEAIADVRRFPGSRRYPWFAGETMAANLPAAGIDYLWLPQLGGRRRTALMCAEAVWWRCHRRLIADVLSERGIPVLHILDAGHVQPHALTGNARVVDGWLVYPPEQQDLFAAT
ncbi:conserved hypothetical protein [uncultured Stenotrophomonas sp.]|uniref:DUF488 domain-containing protein n=1 Tax=uncultured Stenotrophomonas sp. TaxID=165438 RepID=A0A1Y5QAV4_9GAMM|nr:conserved hypothetical protein [uncultured Stenotrophomonas sp.]